MIAQDEAQRSSALPQAWSGHGLMLAASVASLEPREPAI
jgi:hypothetical protein